jgi:hypothetical protein
LSLQDERKKESKFFHVELFVLVVVAN